MRGGAERSHPPGPLGNGRLAEACMVGGMYALVVVTTVVALLLKLTDVTVVPAERMQLLALGIPAGSAIAAAHHYIRNRSRTGARS